MVPAGGFSANPSATSGAASGDKDLTGGQVDGLQAINNQLGGSFNVGGGSSEGGQSGSASVPQSRPSAIVDPLGQISPLVIGGFAFAGLLIALVFMRRK